jgi:predicted Zn finger-like uncharacterized protein
MLILCTSCRSKYLVNSADLKPDGRTVQCAKCGNQWFQDPLINKVDQNEETATSLMSSTGSQNQLNKTKLPTPNLPSTYVKEQKVSLINSILVVLFVIIFIMGFWISRNLEINSLVLLKFYLDEFIFNLKLIFNDIAKIIHQIVNLF